MVIIIPMQLNGIGKGGTAEQNIDHKDLPKGLYIRGNDGIDEWRRLE